MTELATANGSALAIRAEQEAFSRAQIDALRKMNGWDEVPNAELAVFFHQAQRTGLDPFAKQIYLIGRRNNRRNRTDYTIQTSIDGMRLVADRSGTYAGSDRPKFGEEDGDKYAEVTIWKIVQGSRVPFTGVAYLSEFRQANSPMWQRMERTMLAKCAEAQALRKGWPADLSGVYGREEMDQAGPVVSEPLEEAEVVEEDKQGADLHPEHQAKLDQIADVLAQLPASDRPDEEKQKKLMDYARSKYGNACHALNMLEDILAKPSEVAAPSEPEAEDLDDEPVPDFETMQGATRDAAKPVQTARKSQVDLLRTLAEELVDGGVDRLEEFLGKPLEELTRVEADEQIDRLTAQENQS